MQSFCVQVWEQVKGMCVKEQCGVLIILRSESIYLAGVFIAVEIHNIYKSGACESLAAYFKEVGDMKNEEPECRVEKTETDIKCVTLSDVTKSNINASLIARLVNLETGSRKRRRKTAPDENVR